MWHWDGEKPCRVIEVNGRAATLYYIMHNQCFGASLYKAMMSLSVGDYQGCFDHSPLAQKIVRDDLQKVVGALFFVVTFAKGKATDIINFMLIKELNEDPDTYGVKVAVQPDSEISDNGTAGFRVAQFCLFGSSLQEITTEANQRRIAIIKDVSLTPGYG